jgi:hypothetical protein
VLSNRFHSVQCTLNLPHYRCPHCAEPLVKQTNREMLISRLETEIAASLAEEETRRAAEAEERRRQAGAFPSLPSTASSRSPSSKMLASTTAHKVLSLNSKTKKATVMSISKNSVSESLANPSNTQPDVQIIRVPRPTATIPLKGGVNSDRPWFNVQVSALRYIPISQRTSREPTDSTYPQLKV